MHTSGALEPRLTRAADPVGRHDLALAVVPKLPQSAACGCPSASTSSTRQDRPHHPGGAAVDVDVKACSLCVARLELRAVVTDVEVARRLLDAMPRETRAPPLVDSSVVYEPALA